MSRRSPLRALLSAGLVASVVIPAAAHSHSASTPLAGTTLAAPHPYGANVSHTPAMHAPDRARTARLRTAFGHLPFSFEHVGGQAPSDAAYTARGAGYALYVTAKGATLVLASPRVPTRAHLRPTTARPPLLTRPLATAPFTPTATGAVSATGAGVVTVTATTSSTATGALSLTTTLVPLNTATITPTSTGVVSPTATLTAPGAVAAAGAVTATATTTPTATDAVTDVALPTVPPGAGTVVAPVRLAPVRIIRNGPPITETTVLTPTALIAAMALHVRRHGHAHGQDKRPLPAPPAVVQLSFLGANPTPHVVGLDPLGGTVNYLLGAARRGWHTRVPTYGRVAYQDLYPGIDLAFHGRQGALEYDWLLAPHASAGRIRLAVGGAGRLQIDAGGDLLLRTAAGTLRQARPVAYQQSGATRRPVAARYVLRAGHAVGLAVGAYDHSRPLVIDPVLSYATYLGGSNTDQGASIAVDGSGYVYVAGNTLSTNFPTLTPQQATFGGGTGSGDAFISKLTPDGSALVYSTYLGGSGDEDAWSIAVDGAGAVVIAGYTASTNFPVVNAAQPTYGGGPYDGFVSKLSADGSALIYSTYLGGSGDDEGRSMALDGSGNAYVTGLTSSTNFPTTANAAQRTFSGTFDAFVTALTPAGALVYSTYLGGGGDDDGYAIAVDGAGAAYVTGETTSTNFPVSTNAAQRSYHGHCSSGICSYNAFVTKINPGGASIAYSTYLGGSVEDTAQGIAVDGNGNAWVAGGTGSSDFPVSANAAQPTFKGGFYDAFVTEVTPDGSALPYSTYLGGSDDDAAYGIALDGAGHVYVAGYTASTDFPVLNAAQPTYGGAYDAFVTELSAAGGGTIYATYLGGSGDDEAFALAVGPDGRVAVTGLTSSTNFPVTGAVQSAYNSGTYDAFVAGYDAVPGGATCPDGWSCDDVGGPPLAGDQMLSNGTWTLHGSGGDIFNTDDQFHYVSQQVAGDGSIVVRLASQQNTSICSKAGIMYRASTDAGAVNYSVVLLPDCHYSTSSIQVNYRATSNGASTTANDVPLNLPLYLKATRVGATFTAATSSDGVTWTPIPNSNVSLPNMASNALVGMVVCSQNSATTSQATFDNVSLTGATDLSQLDMETGHYTQTINSPSGPTDLQLYNSPAGAPNANGWQPISLTLGMSSSTGLLAPAVVPFGLQLAPTSGQPTLASLSTEDGVTVGIGLALTSGTNAAAMFGTSSVATGVTGQVVLNTITYPSLTFPGVPAPLPTTTLTTTTPATSTAGGLNVYLGYADSLRPNPNVPVPWQGSPQTVFVGHADSGGAYDSGAIRLDNTTASTVTLKDVTVVLHTVNNDGTGGPASGQTFDLWGANSIPPGASLVIAATGATDNFDTSDFPLNGTSCTNPAGPTTNPPHLMLTFADSSQVTMTDTAHVLDTGGVDTANCPGGNESLQWRALGTTGVGQASGLLTLAMPATAQIVGVPYTQVATLADASGNPQPNVAVNFSITSGPNTGLRGQAYTDSQGRATFTYTGTVAGMDTFAASITNASGGVLNADPVNVTWESAPVADLALRSIAMGLDVRIVLRNANTSGPFTLALAPDSTTNTQLAQDPNGVIRATRPITQYGDDGSPAVISQTEYLVRQPAVTDSSTDPAAPAATGPVTSTLVSTAGSNCSGGAREAYLVESGYDRRRPHRRP